MKMTLVMEDGQAKLEDGMPVYEYEDGSKAPFDAQSTTDNLEEKVTKLTDEKDRHFKAANKAKDGLKVFKGIDPEKAKDALETVKALKDKDLLDANAVKAIKAEMAENFKADKKNLIKDTETKLAEILLQEDWKNGSSSGEYEDQYEKYEWKSEVSDWTTSGLKEIELTVYWQQRGRINQIILSTLIYASE